MKESRYVRMSRTMLQILKHPRVSFFPHSKSNHIYTVWQQHVIPLSIRQYESKSYRMFIDWRLIEAQYLRIFIQLSKIPHFTTLQKFADRMAGTCTGKDSFFLYFAYTSKAHLLWHRSLWVSPPMLLITILKELNYERRNGLDCRLDEVTCYSSSFVLSR